MELTNEWSTCMISLYKQSFNPFWTNNEQNYRNFLQPAILKPSVTAVEPSLVGTVTWLQHDQTRSNTQPTTGAKNVSLVMIKQTNPRRYPIKITMTKYSSIFFFFSEMLSCTEIKHHFSKVNLNVFIYHFLKWLYFTRDLALDPRSVIVFLWQSHKK